MCSDKENSPESSRFLKTKMLTKTVPTAPILIQTAYAVPIALKY